MEIGVLNGSNRQSLETVRALHETVAALRTALDKSRQELSELRTQVQVQSVSALQDNSLNETVQKLSKENQILRQQLADNSTKCVEQTKYMEPEIDEEVEEAEKDEAEEGEDDVFKTVSHQETKLDSGAESEDIDDIELVFTTGDTDPRAMHDALIPISEENLQQTNKPSTHTVLVETDISKCGVIEEDFVVHRRNTLPDPIQTYKPIVHRDLLAANRNVRNGKKPIKPVVVNKCSDRQESEAQTDITALPAQWKSETYLAHKIACNLTTLPSKFTLPVPRASHLPLSDKTHEARRVLLSDINFTSMVPELSRSADHLHHEDDLVQGLCKNYPGAFDYMKSFDVGRDGRFLRADKCCHGSKSSCGSRCHGISNTSITPSCCDVTEPARRRHSWRPQQQTSVCCHMKHVWSSVPSSPTRLHHSHSKQNNFGADHCWGSGPHCRKIQGKVTFSHCSSIFPSGLSLPDLRIDNDSGESTDSLVDEAEDFLRRSIDSMLTGPEWRKGNRKTMKPNETETDTNFEPPKSAQPFLPNIPRDLKRDYLVKVITTEGRIVVGKVKYSGFVSGRGEPYVGVELAQNNGVSDGTFLGHRYFDCPQDHGIFVPFKKVVLAWSG